jgi:aryl-alcohol dehydrogenase-like predicted oxidoreductase
MRYRRLGCTDLKVSVIGVGTWQLGGEWGRTYTPADADAIFDAARDCGINLIDTAECYGDHTSETLIGSSIQRDRSKWIVCTKFGHKFHENFTRTDTRRPEDAAEQIDASLRALRSEYIDVLQYHSWADEQFFDDDVLAVVEKAKSAGKVRHLGNSVGKNVNVKQVGASKSRGVEVVQLIYNRLDRKPEETTLPLCREQDVGVLARVPLASGLLSGKYGPGHVFPPGDVRSHWKGMVEGDEKHRELEAAKSEVPQNVPMAMWALAWCLRNPAVSAVIPGCKSPEQVRQNAAAAERSELASFFQSHG